MKLTGAQALIKSLLEHLQCAAQVHPGLAVDLARRVADPVEHDLCGERLWNHGGRCLRRRCGR